MSQVSLPPINRDVTIVRARPGWQAVDLREIWRYRDLLFQLTLREIQVRYKQTILGVFWAVIQPLATTGILTIVIGLLVGRGRGPGVVSTFCAMLPWQLFSNSLTNSGVSLITNQRLITKVYFPRLIVPLSGVLGALADFAVALVALAVVMVITGTTITWHIVALPIFILLAVLTALAVGLWLAALSALYRDFRHVIPFMLQLGFFVSPVMYTGQSVQAAIVERHLPQTMLIVYGLNPMAGVIEGFRWCLLGSDTIFLPILIPSILMTTVLLLGGAMYFRRMERWFADLI